jgi:hypothetical protein
MDRKILLIIFLLSMASISYACEESFYARYSNTQSTESMDVESGEDPDYPELEQDRREAKAERRFYADRSRVPQIRTLRNENIKIFTDGRHYAEASIIVAAFHRVSDREYVLFQDHLDHISMLLGGASLVSCELIDRLSTIDSNHIQPLVNGIHALCARFPHDTKIGIVQIIDRLSIMQCANLTRLINTNYFDSSTTVESLWRAITSGILNLG